MSVRIEQEAIRTYFAHLADEDEDEPVLDAILVKEFLAKTDRVSDCSALSTRTLSRR